MRELTFENVRAPLTMKLKAISMTIEKIAMLTMSSTSVKPRLSFFMADLPKCVRSRRWSG